MVNMTEKDKQYEKFFKEVLQKLREKRRGVEWKIIKHNAHWAAFYRVRHNIWYGVGFTKDKMIRADIHLSHRNSAETNILFNELYKHKERFEGALGFPLSWESPKDLQTEAGRIAVYKQGTISDSAEHVEELADWAVDMTIRLYTCFMGYFIKMLS